MRKLVAVLFAAGLLLGCSKDRRPSAPKERVVRDIPAAADSRPVIVALGDSLTAGLGVDPALNYPSKLQAKIDAAGYRYRVINEGVSGDTSAQGVNRLEAVLELRPKTVILELGANDGLRGLSLEDTEHNLQTIVRRLEQGGCSVVLAGMEIPPNYGPEYTRRFRELFPRLSSDDHTALIPFFLADVAGRADLNQGDGIHPTAEGYDVVVQNVWKVLEPLLRESAGR